MVAEVHRPTKVDAVILQLFTLAEVAWVLQDYDLICSAWQERRATGSVSWRTKPQYIPKRTVVTAAKGRQGRAIG